MNISKIRLVSVVGDLDENCREKLLEQLLAGKKLITVTVKMYTEDFDEQVKKKE